MTRSEKTPGHFNFLVMNETQKGGGASVAAAAVHQLQTVVAEVKLSSPSMMANSEEWSRYSPRGKDSMLEYKEEPLEYNKNEAK